MRCGPADRRGHVHIAGIVDDPFPRAVRDALLADGLAEEHRWVPNSGWITFHVRNEDDLKQCVTQVRQPREPDGMYHAGDLGFRLLAVLHCSVGCRGDVLVGHCRSLAGLGYPIHACRDPAHE